MSSHPAACSDQAGLLALYERDREVHPYGIADLVQLWDRSHWWRDDDAAVGLLDLPGSPVPVVYAVAARSPARTLDLLADLSAHGWLTDRFVVTGPPGLTDRLAAAWQPRWRQQYVKQALTTPDDLPSPDGDVRVLTTADLPALTALHATDDTAGTFFHADLLATGAYVGLEVDGRLVASAGVHVLEPRHGVAAIGNVVTHPASRGRGLAGRTVATLCHRLRTQVATIGLNVAADNLVAIRLYDRLGFRQVHDYEEAELVRRDVRHLHDADDSGSLRRAP